MTQITRYTDPGTGRGTFCEPGGRISFMAEELEDRVLKVAAEDIDRVNTMLSRNEANRDELVRALSYLVQSSKVTLDVARTRGERLAQFQPQEEEASAG